MANTSEIEEATIAEPTQEDAELSKEELAKRRADITNYYKDNIKHLKIQLEYETLLKDIEQTRAERIQAQMFLAQTMDPKNPEGAETEAEQEFKKRTLKRTEA